MSATGRTIGNYVLGSMLGRGGTSEVYAAEHRFLGEPAAVKLLRAHLADSDAATEAVLAEARRTRAIRHPNVVRVLDVGHDDTHGVYLVMERVDGTSLAARLAAGALAEPELRRIGAAIADGMAAAHALGIVHRDLKPANVMLAGDEPRIVDFGIARPGDTIASGPRMGTPAYMAPEQLAGNVVAPAIDIWALGVILYEAATGALPFDTRDGKLPQLTEPAPRAACSPPLADLIAACLARDPTHRPPTIAAIARELRGEPSEPADRITQPVDPPEDVRVFKTQTSPPPEDVRVFKTPTSPPPEDVRVFKTPTSPPPEDVRVFKTQTSPPPEDVRVFKTQTSPPPEDVRVFKTQTSPPPEDVRVFKTQTSPPPEDVRVFKTQTSPPPEDVRVFKTPTSPPPEDVRVFKTQTSPPPEDVRVFKTPTSPRTRRRRWVPIAIGGVVVAAIALVVWQLAPRAETPPRLSDGSEGLQVSPRLQDAGESASRLQIPRVSDAGEIAAPPVAVEIRSTPAGATILVGGKVAGRTPATLELAVGTEIELRRGGFRVAHARVTAAGPIDIQLVKPVRKRPPKPCPMPPCEGLD